MSVINKVIISEVGVLNFIVVFSFVGFGIFYNNTNSFELIISNELAEVTIILYPFTLS